MRLKILTRQKSKGAIFIGTIFFLVFLLYFVPKISIHGSSVVVIKGALATTKQSSEIFGPTELKIPSIKLDSFLERVGLTSRGAIAVPRGPTNAAWFDLGVRPGDVGSAIIVGHYGYWRNGVRAVFNDLHRLRKGNKVYVRDENGKYITFVVRKLAVYGPNDDVSEIFISKDGEAHLNLITCAGTWNYFTQSYSKWLVVFTDRK